MKIENFIAELKANVGKEEEICRKHVQKKYVSFIDKIFDCQRIVRATMEYEEDGRRIFRQNTPARFLQITMVLLSHYTDLEIDEANLVAQYDQLDEVGALEPLNAMLPQNEVNEFTTLLTMTAEDYLANNRTIVSYVNSLMKIPVPEQE